MIMPLSLLLIIIIKHTKISVFFLYRKPESKQYTRFYQLRYTHSHDIHLLFRPKKFASYTYTYILISSYRLHAISKHERIKCFEMLIWCLIYIIYNMCVHKTINMCFGMSLKNSLHECKTLRFGVLFPFAPNSYI